MEPGSATEFLISKIENCDNICQVLIVTRDTEGEISYDSYGQIMADALGMLAFVEVAAKEFLRQELSKEGWDGERR